MREIGFETHLSLSYGVENAYAHSPHDVIDSLALSPSYDQDKTLFIVIGDKLLKSKNGGFGWRRSVNGLDNKHLLKSIAVSPSFHIDKTLFVSSDGDGIYRSRICLFRLLLFRQIKNKWQSTNAGSSRPAGTF